MDNLSSYTPFVRTVLMCQRGFTQFVQGQMSCANSVRFSKRLEISIPNGPFPFQTPNAFGMEKNQSLSSSVARNIRPRSSRVENSPHKLVIKLILITTDT
jgi:hypothetical protein